MANTFDRRRINVKGGGDFRLRDIDPTPAASFTQLGFLSEITITDGHELVISKDDSGRLLDAKSGGQEVIFKGTLKQTSKEEIDIFLGAEGKYFEVYYGVTLNNGRYQEYLFPVCRIKPGFEMQFAAATERGLPVEVHVLAPATALVRTPTSWNTAKWQAYLMVENAALANPPSDNGSVPQGAI